MNFSVFPSHNAWRRQDIAICEMVNNQYFEIFQSIHFLTARKETSNKCMKARQILRVILFSLKIYRRTVNHIVLHWCFSNFCKMSKNKKLTKEEELLLQDFGRNVSTKSSLLFYCNAFFVSAVPLCKCDLCSFIVSYFEAFGSTCRRKMWCFIMAFHFVCTHV